MSTPTHLPFPARATLPHTTPLSTHLFHLMTSKKSNLCLSADVSSTSELLTIAEDLGEHIVVLKTHADIVDDWSRESWERLGEVAGRKGFLLFEDRKFGDIGSTVQKQYTSGPLQIIKWAQIVNCHVFPGSGIITALESAAQAFAKSQADDSDISNARGLLLLAEMSSKGHLMTPEYTTTCLDLARQHREFVTGFIAQSNLNRGPDDNFIIMTPGVQLPPEGESGERRDGDALGQQYRTPRKVVIDEGSDIVIVGRGILGAKDRKATAEVYRRLAWEAYEERVGLSGS